MIWRDVRSYPMLAVVMDAGELSDVIARARRKEPDAFDALINIYNARLYGYFYRLTGSRHDAEDLLQEVFVRLVRMIGDYEHNGRFDGWLFRIATNLVRDRVRRSRKGRPGGVESASGFGSGEQDPLAQRADLDSPEPSAAIEHAEEVDRLQWAIGQLPEAEREVVMLRHFSQLTFREIADMMGTPLGTALARAHRGLAKLRELMESLGFSPASTHSAETGVQGRGEEMGGEGQETREP